MESSRSMPYSQHLYQATQQVNSLNNEIEPRHTILTAQVGLVHQSTNKLAFKSTQVGLLRQPTARLALDCSQLTVLPRYTKQNKGTLTSGVPCSGLAPEASHVTVTSHPCPPSLVSARSIIIISTCNKIERGDAHVNCW